MKDKSVLSGFLVGMRLKRLREWFQRAPEAADRKWRGQVGQRGFFFFTAGFLSLSLINHLTRGHWRRHILLLSTVSAAISCILCIVLEGKSKADSNWPQLAIEAVGFTAASIAGNA
ncbi:hypothetical protein V6N13_128873 [Hibiscus sabdariffa]